MAGLASSARADAADHCCICLDSLDAEDLGRQWLTCGHVMHEQCVAELRRRGASGRCLLCWQSHADLSPVPDRAAMHYQRKEHEEAAELWAEVLDVEPSNTTAAVNLGWHYQSQKGGFHKAMEPYEEARRGEDEMAAFNLGNFYW